MLTHQAPKRSVYVSDPRPCLSGVVYRAMQDPRIGDPSFTLNQDHEKTRDITSRLCADLLFLNNYL